MLDSVQRHPTNELEIWSWHTNSQWTVRSGDGGMCFLQQRGVGKFCENYCQNCANGCDESGLCIGGKCEGFFGSSVGPYCNLSCSRCWDSIGPVSRKLLFLAFLTNNLGRPPPEK